MTISTNMAGRGTDIKLGGPNEEERERVAALGGLYVIGTNRHESLRIDNQLRGRAGRQGDPGSSRFFISLEDDIFERYGLARRLFSRYRLERQDAPVDNDLLRKEILHGQRVIEGRNLDIRRALWDYSTLVETQRRIVAGWRDAVFGPPTGERRARPFAPVAGVLPRPGSPASGARPSAGSPAGPRSSTSTPPGPTTWPGWPTSARASTSSPSGGRSRSRSSRRPRPRPSSSSRAGSGRAVEASLRSLVAREGPVDLEAEGLKGPSSTWTYLVNEDQFGWGVELLKGTNIGFAAGAAAFYGPLFVFALLVNRLKKEAHDGLKQKKEGPRSTPYAKPGSRNA